MLQCGEACCSVLQCVAACGSVLQDVVVCCSVLQCVAVCCSVLQCVAVDVVCLTSRAASALRRIRRYSVLPCAAMCCSVLQMSQCVTVYCAPSCRVAPVALRVLPPHTVSPQLQYLAVCCSVLQCVACVAHRVACVALCVPLQQHAKYN